MAVFGVDALACRHGEFCARHLKLKGFFSDQMHLNPRKFIVPARLMDKAVQRNSTAKLAIDAGRQIEIELRCHPARIIIGSLQRLAAFDQIHPDQQLGWFAGIIR